MIKISLREILILFAGILIIFAICYMNRSSFGEIFGINKSYSCENDNRLYPSGNISADYLNLNKYERDKLMVDFIKNGS